jgi:phosphoribosylaminoimidazole-succinocarboxamide synthase
MLKQFSAKTLIIKEGASRKRSGVGIFKFTDDYSVFHFGKMPDKIPNKGESICRMAVHNLLLIEKTGIKTHFRDFIPPNKMRFSLFRILYPHLGQIKNDERNYFIPLQIIFRNKLPQGSSVFRRLERKEISLDQLGLRTYPSPGENLDKPIIEFTTKLEEIDRFISENEAKNIAGLNDRQMDNLKKITLQVNDILTKKAKSVGFEHADGKIEFGLDSQESLVLVDTAGTTDDNRFIYNGFHLSKQVIRNYYLEKNLETKIQNWVKSKVPRNKWLQPEKLPESYINKFSELYKSICEHWINKKIWNSSSIEDAIQNIKQVDPNLISSQS